MKASELNVGDECWVRAKCVRTGAWILLDVEGDEVEISSATEVLHLHPDVVESLRHDGAPLFSTSHPGEPGAVEGSHPKGRNPRRDHKTGMEFNLLATLDAWERGEMEE